MKFETLTRMAVLTAFGATIFACSGDLDGDPSATDDTSAAVATRTTTEQPAGALNRLQKKVGNAAKVENHKATGAARFISLPANARALLAQAAKTDSEKVDRSVAFFRDYGAAVGVTNPAAMRLQTMTTDALGHTHLTFTQYHGSVPVFGAELKTHFDAAGRIEAIAGTAIPGITVKETPTWSRDAAAAVARASVVAEHGDSDLLRVGGSTLYVYRTSTATA
jgi:bacillolysin